MDGLKTGMTDAAGYCLVASADREGMRLISVVMGTDGPKARANASRSLLNYGFRFFETHRLYAAGAEVNSARVWKGDAETVSLGVAEDLYITIPSGRYDDLEAVMQTDAALIAPLSSAREVGRVSISLDGELVAERDLFPLRDVDEGSLWRRMVDSIMLWFE